MRLLTLTEAKLLMREPLALFWGLAFPMVLLAVMGLSTATIGGLPLAAVYEPIVIAFISVVFGVQGLPVHVASYREGRILRRPGFSPWGGSASPSRCRASPPASPSRRCWPPPRCSGSDC